MKIFLWILCVTFCVFTSLRAETYILTVQHSGSMWSLYSLHTMTKREIGDCNFYGPEKHIPIRDWHRFYHYNAGIDQTKDRIYFAHSIERFNNAKLPLNKENDKLLIVLRNFKECFSSLRISPNQLIEILSKPKRNVFLQNLVNNLNLYESWSPENRLLVYYEDLLVRPQETFESMLAWLGEDSQSVHDYMQDLDTHKANCLHLYKTNKVIKGFANTKSKGQTVFYTKNVSTESLQTIDQLFAKKYPHLWKYFERFKS